jgi:hypothetical protein
MLIKLTKIIKGLLLAILLSGIMAAGGTTGLAQSAQKNGKKYVATKEIIFDKATKQLRKPTDAETQALVDQVSTLTNRSTEGLTVKQLPNGTKQVNLQGRFNEVVLGRANADGTVETRCVSSLEEAIAFLGLEEVN